MVKARVPLINGIRSLAYRLFRNQDDSLKACVRLSKTGNAECGTACRPRRARPEAHSCGVALLAKGYGHYLRSASGTCTLQITQRPYAINQRCPRIAASLLVAGLFVGSVSAQDLGIVGSSPYEFITQDWMKPFAGDGFTWGGTSGIYVESADRIFVLQRGETELPDPLPEEYTNFAGSLGWNVLGGRGRVWQNCIYIIDSEGNLLEVWDQWDHLFTGTDGPGPHRIRISPYDPEKRVWVVDETGHIIYVFSNDGNDLLMTLGEKNIPGTDETHYAQPQDVAFLPDGKFLIADGLRNTRIVVRDADGSYISEFGEEGDAPHQFGSVHALAFGPDERLYALDRDNLNIKVFQQTENRNSDSYPSYDYVTTWGDLGMPLDITVSDSAAWVTDLNPPKIVQFNLDGSRKYTWNLPVEGPDFWIEMHSVSVDEDGNLYGTDNQAGRPQKMVPRSDSASDLIVGTPYVPH